MIARHRYPELDADHEAGTAYAAWVTRAMDQDLYLGWVAESAGEVVGGAGLMLLEWGPTRNDPSPWRGRIVNVYTAPAVRRQGIARLLLAHALQEARQRGLHTLSLGTTEQARGLYEQAGFRPSGSELVRRTPALTSD
ncbi:GNAT family N-acetyltransferase [Deinococcus ficus]|uniref:GNAT family N-acetyltransferase n=1 Tax=Deinococcus ficus TaxID=317577 RepID=UPI00040DD7C6|nr:GNAT family N-acetyltransferase [Deinococcus ficus]